MKSKVGIFALMMLVLSFCWVAFAQVAGVPAEVAPVIPPVVVPEVPVTDFFTQVFEAIKGFGGFPWWGKITVICTLLVSSMRVSILKPLWEKLGAAKIALAPLFALVIGVVSLGSGTDGKITGAALLAYLLAGGGSIILHQLLDALKELPFVTEKYDAYIDVVKSLLGGKKAQ